MNDIEHKKAELYEKLKQAISIKRRQLGEQSLFNFSSIYLQGLMSSKSGDLHKEMMSLLRSEERRVG